MRQKKSILQIEEQQQQEQISSDLKTPKFQFHNNPNFNKTYKFRFSHLRIQIPTNHHEQQSISNKTHLLLMNPQKETILATKQIAFKLLNLFLIKLPPRVLIILSLPPIYFFSLHHYTSLYLYIIFLIAFCVILFSSFNLNTFHTSNITQKFPFLKLYFKSNKASSKTCPPVVWSIGSKNRFEKHTISGFLVKVYSNGDVYEGEFYKGKCSGSGVYYYNLNGRYEGDWVDQKYDGYGVETWAKGSRYRGQYRQGLRHGFGIYRFYTGDMYAGEWFKGQCHGCGVHSCEDGSKYCGEFKGGVKHGLGHYRFRNGDTYAGEYFADKMHGFGVYHFANGHRYEGAWHEGRRQGVGSYTFRNGDTQSGHWENGVLGVSASDDVFLPESSTSVSHARVLKAIQEARHIAEKAVGVAEVDERVNRAITAANRAANAARVAAVKAVQNQIQHHDETGHLSLPIV